MVDYSDEDEDDVVDSDEDNDVSDFNDVQEKKKIKMGKDHDDASATMKNIDDINYLFFDKQT